ncbi:hypothetical protein [Kitasatospora purpeofusca]|uniref:hypothetical protein n=1 Tax=Kitasatospora purpeofusca TaxID=67352 RepID=UPI0036D4059F
MAYSTPVDRLHLDRKRLRGALSGFSRVLKAHYDRSFWPMWWTEAVSVEEGRATEFSYYVGDTVAKRWREARAEG